MIERTTLYIGGHWLTPSSAGTLQVTDSNTGDLFATIPAGSEADVNAAVSAARAAFPGWSQTSSADRAKVLQKVSDGLLKRGDALTRLIATEVGTPLRACSLVQVAAPANSWAYYARLAQQFDYEARVGNSMVVREPVGVVAAITPWNYPLHQITQKIAPALASGCTVVLKPSEIAPLNAFVLAEVIHEAGLPPGVFNLVTGLGPLVGEALAAHPEVDMVSFTGSTRAGKQVSRIGSETIKRISLELGGKSASIVLDDADLAKAVQATVSHCYLNSGQTCAAWTRMLVPRDRLDHARDRKSVV